MIKPTIGRKLYYYPNGADVGFKPDVGGFKLLDDGAPVDANIVFVHEDDGTINIAGFDHVGMPFSRGSVKLVQDGETPPEGAAYCAWMPYQTEQARTAAAMAEAAAPAPEIAPQPVDVEAAPEAEAAPEPGTEAAST